MWDERYSSPEYAYGTEPNLFLRAHAQRIPKGNVLSLAEGEGRNAVYLAQLGYQVTAVDGSAVGLAKGQRLAQAKGVEDLITWIHADLADYDLGTTRWEGIISIFCPLPSTLRTRIHHAVTRALKPQGIYLLEAYNPNQINQSTGGGKSLDVLQSVATLSQELPELHFEHLCELDREVIEGIYHTGIGSVVQAIGQKF